MFLVAVGAQLIMASQTLIIQRTLAEGATILWGFGTKLFFLVSQIIWRISDVTGPVFSEMMVRGERDKLRTRYKEMVMLTASLSAFLAVGYVLCNSTFATLLSHGDVIWPPINDLALGVWMILSAVQRCHSCLVLHTKQVGLMRYIFFVEGLVFVSAALLVARFGGLLAVIICSILCTCLFSGSYGTWRIHRYFDVPIREVGWHWLALMGRTLLLCATLAFAVWWIGTFIEQPFVRLAVYASVYGPAGLYVLLRHGLTPGFQRELSARAPRVMSLFLRRIFVTVA
jgi:O-antigen/teichoic acid export membrane protein